jgi:hypothetical protein
VWQDTYAFLLTTALWAGRRALKDSLFVFMHARGLAKKGGQLLRLPLTTRDAYVGLLSFTLRTEQGNPVPDIIDGGMTQRRSKDGMKAQQPGGGVLASDPHKQRGGLDESKGGARSFAWGIFFASFASSACASM